MGAMSIFRRVSRRCGASAASLARGTWRWCDAGLAAAATSAAWRPPADACCQRLEARALLSAGDLDPSFGAGGKVTTDFGFGRDYASDVAVQADGKIVVGGGSNGSDNSDNCILARYNTDGGLDPSFGTAGKVNREIGSRQPQYISALVIQPDGKIVAAGDHSGDFAIARYNPDGSLDLTFGVGGRAVTDFGSGSDQAAGVVLQPDGKIVVGGTTGSSDTMFAVARYGPDGTLDPAFSGDGKATTNFTTDFDSARSVALQSDGKVVLAGSAYNSARNPDFALARYNPDGGLDTSFAVGGLLTTDFGGWDTATGVVIQRDGKVLAAGGTGTNESMFALARYTADGRLDPNFGVGGRRTTDFGTGQDYAAAVVVQPDDHVVLVGAASAPGGNQVFALAKYTPSGTLDIAFGTGGRTTTAFSPSADARAVAVQPDGKLVVAGAVAKRSVWDLGVARYNVDGTLDHGFGTDGIVTTDFVTGSDLAVGVAVQADQKIVVVGTADNIADGGGFAVARYQPSGSLDLTFAVDGSVTTRFGTASGASDDYAYAVAVQPDGRIVVAGRSGPDFAVARYNLDGSLDSGFGGDGKVVASGGAAHAVAIQPDGKIVVAGVSGSNIALIRYRADGTLDTSFDGDGRIFAARFGTYGSDHAYGVVIQPDGKIVVAGTAGQQQFALLRYKADGTPDVEFDFDGRLTSALNGVAFGVTLQPDGKIVAAGQNHVGGGYRFGLARHNADGSLDASFDGDGRVTSAFGGSAYGVLVQADGKIVAAGDSAASGSSAAASSFRLARYHEDGSLDASFGTGGTLTTAFGPGTSGGKGLALQADSKLVAAGYANIPPTGYDFAVARYSGGNTAPAVDAGGTYSVTEGSAAPLAGSAADAEGGTLVYEWDLDGDGAFDDATGPTPMLDATQLDGPASVTVALRVTDAGGMSATARATVDVLNAAPVPVPPAVAQAPVEGTLTAIDLGAFADAGAADGPWAATVDWGDGSPAAYFTADTRGPLGTLSHTYVDNLSSGGTYTASVCVSDKDGAVGMATFPIAVTNAPPVPAIAGLPAAAVAEGTPVTLTASATDPGPADAAVGFALAWSVSTADGVAVASGEGSTFTFTPADDGRYSVTLVARDKDGAEGVACATVVAHNVAPVARITGPEPGAVYATGAEILLTGAFVDPGLLDSHRAQWLLTTWASGVAVTVNAPGTVSSAGLVSGTANVAGAGVAAGVYRVSLVLTDDDGGTAQASTIDVGSGPAVTQEEAYVVVYDPSAGYVTGGGWIDSPAGAYASNPALAGRASFGFVSQYKKGANAPTGNTEFQFRAGNLHYSSTSYDWLVVGGQRAQYKGTGTINGAGSFGFILTAVDGAKTGTADKFRIKIWDRATGAVVYDNQMRAADDAEATTAIGGGSIVVHTK